MKQEAHQARGISKGELKTAPQESGALGSDLLALPEALETCCLCPRLCGAHRLQGQKGCCGADDTLRIARAALHFWEEPPISGDAGSGAIFFSHCPLRCSFCQNGHISAGGFGKTVSIARLARIMLELQGQGAHNINLVTPTHYAAQAREAARRARSMGLTIPLVYNTSGYELPQIVDALSDDIDVWLPDCKYASGELACNLSKAPGYLAIALTAIDRMVRAVKAHGGRYVDESGIMKRGVIVRHLVLPGHVDDSLHVLDALWECFGNDIDISVMNQYTPLSGPQGVPGAPELGRSVTDEEYETVLDHADDLGFERMWWQQGGTVSESFVPKFDATGVEGPE